MEPIDATEGTVPRYLVVWPHLRPNHDQVSMELAARDHEELVRKLWSELNKLLRAANVSVTCDMERMEATCWTNGIRPVGHATIRRLDGAS